MEQGIRWSGLAHAKSPERRRAAPARGGSAGGRSAPPGPPGLLRAAGAPRCLPGQGSFLFNLKIGAHRFVSLQMVLAADFQKHTRPFRGEGRRGRERRRGGDKRDTDLCRVPPCRGLAAGGRPRHTEPWRSGGGGSPNPPTQTLTPYQYQSLTRALLQIIMTSQSCCGSRKHASHSHRSILHPRKVT